MLANFPHTKRLKTYLPRWPAYRIIPIVPCDSQRSKWVPPGTGDFLRLLVGELGTPNLPKFSPIPNGYTLTVCYYTLRQIWTKDVWKRAILRADVLFHQKSLPLPPKSPQNLILGPFNAKPIIERAVRKSHVNRATKLKLYSYIFIGILGGVLKFSARGRPGGRRVP